MLRASVGLSSSSAACAGDREHVRDACARARRRCARRSTRAAPRRARARRSATRSARSVLASTIAMFDSTLRKNGQRACISAQQREPRPDVSREPRVDRGAEAVPARQHQPALAPAEHPGNRAQVLDARRRGARRRPAADVELGDLGDRRRRAEVRDEVRRLVDERAIGARSAMRRQRVQRRVDTPARARRCCSASTRLASSVAATSVSRLRRPSSGSEYLLAMISPCSVMRRPPVTLPAGCARIAS